MWIAEFRVWHECSFIIPMAKDYGVKLSLRYLNAYKEKGKTYISKVMTVEGNRKKEFVEALRKTKVQINKTEGEQIFYSLPLPDVESYHMLLLDRSVFFLKPAIVKDGYEYWTLASWNKKQLTNLYRKVGKSKQKATIELLKLRQEKVNFFEPEKFGELSERQLEALKLAVSKGCYEFPKRTHMEQLAKRMKISKATLQEHLSRAEGRIMSAFVKDNV